MSLLSFLKQKPAKAYQPRIEDWPLTYMQDGLWTIHNVDFMTEPKFARAYARGVQAVEKDHNIH